jgi:hypothetical protein
LCAKSPAISVSIQESIPADEDSSLPQNTPKRHPFFAQSKQDRDLRESEKKPPPSGPQEPDPLWIQDLFSK